MKFIRNSIFLFLILCCGAAAQGQNLVDFNQKRNDMSKKAMISLGSWSLLNLGGSTAGLLLSEGERAKGFHQMNILFNVVNLGLAIPGYVSAKKDDPTAYGPKESYKAQLKKEKIFLFNTAFDFTYVAGGFYLRERSKWDLEHSEKLLGLGNSLIIQGSFLIALDLTMTLLHTRNRKRNFDAHLQLSSGPNGLGAVWKF
ncbi:MAG: hypothetical protein MI810_24365 [Flavobacteriales bacterium]|nr:hypothetical protein [Flavobacteriales bacterium]